MNLDIRIHDDVVRDWRVLYALHIGINEHTLGYNRWGLTQVDDTWVWIPVPEACEPPVTSILAGAELYDLVALHRELTRIRIGVGVAGEPWKEKP